MVSKVSGVFARMSGGPGDDGREPVVLENIEIPKKCVDLLKLVSNPFKYGFEGAMLHGSSLLFPILEKMHGIKLPEPNDIDIFACTGEIFREFRRGANKFGPSPLEQYMRCKPEIKEVDLDFITPKYTEIRGKWKGSNVNIILFDGSYSMASAAMDCEAPIASVVASLVQEGRKCKAVVLAHPDFEEHASKLLYKPMAGICEDAVCSRMDKWRRIPGIKMDLSIFPGLSGAAIPSRRAGMDSMNIGL